MNESRPIAHVRFDENNQPIKHWLDDHLRDVATLAEEFAEHFGADWARVAGRWHDLGKFNPEFQEYIRDKTGYERENAHVEKVGRVDHSTAGASYAADKLGVTGRILAYLIAGHHAGLPDWHQELGSGGALKKRLEDKTHLQKAMAVSIPVDILASQRCSPLLLHAKPRTLPCGCGCCFLRWSMQIFWIPNASWMKPNSISVGSISRCPVCVKSSMIT